MSGDATSGDIQIPSVFMLAEDGERLRNLAASGDGEVFILLTWIRKEGEGEEGEEEEGEELLEGGQSSESSRVAGDNNRQSSPSHNWADEKSNH